jgi:molybdenum cofactor synthesis domain-containing protein
MRLGRLVEICVSETRGRKAAVPEAFAREGLGIEGDIHAGRGHRQVSLLERRDIDSMRAQGVELTPGAFGENLIVEGIDLVSLGLGSRLRVGTSAELRISQIGKECHTPCQIYAATGDCIMPRTGLFARVVQSGPLRPGDPVEIVEPIDPKRFQTVVITISDRCSRGEAEDTAGPAVAGLLEGDGPFHIYRRRILPDVQAAIEKELRHYCDGHKIDLVLTVGGTGCAPRDVTPEATRSVIERPTPGLDEAMRAASLAKKPHAMLSRGVSGIRRSTLIVNLPGSEKAAVENLSTILAALPHALEKLRGDPSDCAPRGEPGGPTDSMQSREPASGPA